MRGRFVPIGGRAFEIIEVLVRSAGQLVTKDDLMHRIWPGAIVEDNTLQVHISAVRKALGPDRGMLKTASGRGYRLLGDWTPQQEIAPPGAAAREPEPTQVEQFQTNLPASGPDLIGRTTAVEFLRDLLSAYRIVTLTGPGGIGKTKLALEVARLLFPTFQGDVWLAELASLADPGLVPSAVARVIGLRIGGDEISPEPVARAIGTRRLLLVLDNCEHVIDAAATLAETITRRCPRAIILATSREVLRIDGEYVYRVAPLAVPPEHQDLPDTVLGHSAVQLFVARTTASDSDFSPREEDIPAIAAICRRLDGIPLAIEFAAARTAALGLQQVASRLDQRFGLLTGGRRTAPPRHQTLRATLDWSYELLPDYEQRLLRHLAVFPGGCTLQAAASVLGDAGGAASRIAGGISSLVAKSLVTLDGSVSASRWRLLETIREYAHEKLQQCGEADQAARRHAEFLRDLFASAAPDSSSPPSVEDMARYRQEIDNVRAALDWSFSPAGDTAIGVVLTAAYVPAWLHCALLVECRERAQRALDCLAPDVDLSESLQMQLHLALGLTLTYTMGSVERARMALANALRFAESLDNVVFQLQTLWAQWVLHFNIGECRATQFITQQFARAARRTGSETVSLIADRLDGYVLQHAGEQREAQRRFERVLAHYVAPKDRQATVWSQLDQRVLARAMLARALCLQGYVDQAVQQAGASLEAAQVTDYHLSICEALRLAVCPVALMTGDLAAAEHSVAMLVDLATNRNATFWRIVGRCLEGKLLIMRGEFRAGLGLLRTEIDASQRTGWAIWYPEFLGALAEGFAGLGRITEGLVTIDQALARADGGGELYYVAELLRIKGELLLQTSAEQTDRGAEGCFHDAFKVARQHGALFWELRIALSLARWRVRQDRPDDARDVLAPVYSQFTEGFSMVDLRAARTMLEALPPHETRVGQ